MENQDGILNSPNFESNGFIDEQKNISLNSFIFLSVISCGTYGIWWMYKAWKFFQQKEQSDIMPAARALFNIFFLFSLFNKILDYAKEKGYNNNYSSIALFIGYILGNLFSIFPAPLGYLMLLSFVCLIPPFKALNWAKSNSTDFIITHQYLFTRNQRILILLFTIFWVLFFIGITMGNVK